MGRFGLSEDVAERVVSLAHDAGLQVLTHMENAYDFRIGLKIGVGWVWSFAWLKLGRLYKR